MDCSTVVLVEDDIDIRELVTEALELEGYTVIACTNGADALEKLKTIETPCLILLDLMMPVMDGETFLQIRRTMTAPIRTVPVYLVSAIADQEKAEKTGANGYMRKPVDLESLVQLVKGHCHAAEMEWNEKDSEAWQQVKDPASQRARLQ